MRKPPKAKTKKPPKKRPSKRVRGKRGRRNPSFGNPAHLQAELQPLITFTNRLLELFGFIPPPPNAGQRADIDELERIYNLDSANAVPPDRKSTVEKSVKS